MLRLPALSGLCLLLVLAACRPPLPTDPSEVAEPLDDTQHTSLAAATEFLYSGENPIQTGVAEGTIEAKRAAVIRGRVLDRDGEPLAGVTVSVQHHPEFGETLTREDGRFDLAVNGGGEQVINYDLDEHLPVQRSLDVPWRDYAVAEEVVMIALDAAVTPVDLGEGFQVARGSLEQDVDGARRTSVVFPQGTEASMTLPDGSQQSLETLNVRATEYTVGDNGPEAMPGELPLASGYTYAMELSVDEALDAGATRVDFNQPVPVYVDNFLGFPTGEPVPAGWYDRERAAWIPAEDGRIIKVLGAENGLAQLDFSGDGQPADAQTLADWGVSEDEQRYLAETYAAGKTLWRVPVDHFTPWDCNWPYGPPPGATEPLGAPVDETPPDTDDADECIACIIEPQSQTLGESLPVAGTPYELNYRSDRTRGYRASRTLDIPLAGDEVPADIQGADLQVRIAGQLHEWSYDSLSPGQTETFVWDGLDAYGREVGSATAKVKLSYRYRQVYYAAQSDFNQSFAGFGDSTRILGYRDSQGVALEREWQRDLRAPLADAAQLGGWSLSAHHRYDPDAQVLYLGDGGRRSAVSQGAVIETVAGNGVYLLEYPGDTDDATAIAIGGPGGMAFDPRGNRYLALPSHSRVVRITPQGTIETVIGTGEHGYSGDGGPADEAKMRFPDDLVWTDDERLLIAGGNDRIRSVGPDGVIKTIAGNGQRGYSGDGGPATEAQLFSPSGLALAEDGTLYIAEHGNDVVRQVSPGGRITTLAGDGVPGYSGDGGPASQARLRRPSAVAVGSDGAVYIADTGNHVVRRIGRDGVIDTVVGTGSRGFSGDGGLASAARLNAPTDVAFDRDGRLYLADWGNDRIRRVNSDGRIQTLAGSGQRGYGGDGDVPLKAKVSPVRLTLDAMDNLYISDGQNFRLRRVRNVLPDGLDGHALASRDGTQLYRFDDRGRHLETVDTRTGASLHQFDYDEAGRLSSITDAHGNRTAIERQSDGTVSALVAPDGQRTSLGLNADGYLASHSMPTGETHHLAYGQEGLLTAFTDPRGHSSDFDYDDLGRLVRDRDPAGGGWDLERTELDAGYRVDMTTGEGRLSSFTEIPRADGERLQIKARPDGTETRILHGADGSREVTLADGTQRVETQAPDDRFGMQSALPGRVVTTTPQGRSRVTTYEREASLADESDLLSLTDLTERLSVDGDQTVRHFDAADRLWTTTTPEGRTSRQWLDDTGRLVEHQPAGETSSHLEYDDRGRLIRSSRGQDEQRAVQYAYDGNGYLSRVTDIAGRSLLYQNDASGRLQRQTHPNGSTVDYDYDASGNLTGLTLPSGEQHRFDYTARDQTDHYDPPAGDAASTEPPLGSDYPVTTYRYNLDKQLVSLTRPDGATLDYDYNATSGRLERLTLPAGEYQYAYLDAEDGGQLSRITAPGGQQLTFQYDGILPTRQRWEEGVTGMVSQDYNDRFQVSQLSVNGTGIERGYNADGQLTRAGDFNLNYASDSFRLTGTDLGLVDSDHGYNNLGELNDFSSRVSGTTLYGFELSRNAIGQIKERTETIEGATVRTQYEYDNLGRLTDVIQEDGTHKSWRYDDNGNRTHENGVRLGEYDAQDRLLSYGDNQYDYTANGELARKTNTTSGEVTTYDYDAFSNLRSVTLADGTEIDYLIDGRNRRVGKRVNGTLEQGFLYKDALNPVAELDGDGDVIARFVYGAKPQVPAYMIKDGETYRLVSDHLGSVRLVVNSQTGQVAQRLEYDAWGQVTEDTNPGFQPFGYAGGIYDRDTGLVRFGARDYDPEVGRWTTKDPIGFEGSNNQYVYVTNVPTQYADPSGNIACGGVCIGAGVVVGKAIISGGASYIGARATGSEHGDATRQAAIGATVGAVTTPGANMAVKAGANSLVVTSAQSAMGSAVSQYGVNGEIGLFQTGIAALAALPAAKVEKVASRLGASQLEANFLGTYVGTSLDVLANEVIDRWGYPRLAPSMCGMP